MHIRLKNQNYLSIFEPFSSGICNIRLILKICNKEMIYFECIIVIEIFDWIKNVFYKNSRNCFLAVSEKYGNYIKIGSILCRTNIGKIHEGGGAGVLKIDI